MCYEHKEMMEEIKIEPERETAGRQNLVDQFWKYLQKIFAEAARTLCGCILEYDNIEGMYFIGTATLILLTGYFNGMLHFITR